MSDSVARVGLARAAAGLHVRSRAVGALPPLVLMTDEERLEDPVAAARALPRGSMVIVRARDRDRRARLADDLMKVAKGRGLVVLIAEDACLARSVGADGLHLPERRAGEAVHWRARCPNLLITVAAHSLTAVARARAADAILLAPVFDTSSHPGRRPLTPVRANLMSRLALKPVYALGGIDARNASRITGSNFVGIAAVSALGVVP